MKNTKIMIATSFLAILLVAIATPLTVLTVSAAEEETTPATLTSDENWTYIQNDMVTIVFPTGGKKPMFLWWYTNNSNNINVVKFKGLIEYYTYEKPYFLWRCMAEARRIRERIQAHYYGPRQHILQNLLRLKALKILDEIADATDLHAPYLPFSGCKWELTCPANVTRGDVKYLSFNFTLIDVPQWRERMQFAENNIILRCRFYYTPATEDVYGKYTYTVGAGELKIDIVIKHWEWNIDKLEPILDKLRELGIDIPKHQANLALWINLASINMTKLETAENDAESVADMTEAASTAQNMYVEGSKVSVVQNDTGKKDETPLQKLGHERFRMRFEKGNAEPAGFFKFVPQAIITDGITYNTTDVTASYISAGNHMRLFIGYPYFGNKTLEHDPSLGVEVIPSLIAPLLIGTLIIIATTIGITILIIKQKRKIINIVKQ